jgi:hypothetical protein
MIEETKRRAVFSELKGYCIFAGDSDFIEVTNWSKRRWVRCLYQSQE